MRIIEVRNKQGVPDVFGQDVRKNIREMGISGIEEVVASEIYGFEDSAGDDELRYIAENILVDSVIQEYCLNGEKQSAGEGRVVIDVFYKKGVTDSVADTVKTAVKDAGIKTDISISTGKRYYLRGSLTEEDVKSVCMKLLANPLVQNYSIRYEEGNKSNA
ncbi:MAG: phosphoribosylformylglycinamidine synthase subunit PurS [Candidatus Omnitrophica bacterium]|nr:phosphoribosylformylglycinamidine synthase subunit PurS [Candidatus Omnitrophota bacterium]